MKKTIIGCFLLGISALAAVDRAPHTAPNQTSRWESIGPSGGMIGALAVHPIQTGRMVAVTDNYPYGVFQSTDGGLSWRHLFDSKSWYREDVVFDPFDPATIHLLLDKNLYTTMDGGNSWAVRPLPDHYEGSGTLLADRANRGVLFAAARRFITVPPNFDGSAMAILKSIDGGATWTGTTLSSASYVARTQCLSQDPADPRVLYAAGATSDASGSFARIFRSSDGGTTWALITTLEAYNVLSIVVDPADSGHLLAGTDRGVYLSRDGGTSWGNVLPSAYVWRMAFDSGDPRIVYAGANDGFKKSTDGGATWTAGPGGVIKSRCTGLTATAPGNLFVSSQAGIQFSSDGGASWTGRMNGIRAGAVNAVGVAPSAPNVVYFAGFYGEMFKSTDFGETVTRLSFPQPTGLVSKIQVNPADADDLFVRANGILRSRDGGRTWTSLLPGCSDFVLGRPDVNRLSAVATVSTNNGDDVKIAFFKSVDGGATWTSQPLYDNPPLPTWAAAVAVDSVNPNIVFVGLNFSDWENSSIRGVFVLKSRDGGATWAEVARWDGMAISDITADPAAPGFLYLAADSGIFKSQDGGASWRKTGDMGAGYARDFEFHPLDPREIWVGLYDDVYFSQDRGETWSRTYGWSIWPHITQIDFSSDGTLLYAGTWNTGAYRLRRTGAIFSVQLSGTIVSGAGAPIPGVLLTLTNNPGTAVTDAAGRYTISIPTGWSGTLTPSANGLAFAPLDRTYTTVISDLGGQEFVGSPAPTIGLSREKLNFGAVQGGPKTPAQSLVISNLGSGTLNWTGISDVPWIVFAPQVGTGPRTIAVSIDHTGLQTGTYAGHLTFTAAGASNSPQAIPIFLKVAEASSDRPPFGYLDTPLDGSDAAGSVAVTGWALDDIEVSRVEIKRDPVGGESGPAIGPDGLVYIGDAVFVPGARPDVEKTFPETPRNDRAGWGYMLLTNALPGGGNGTFSFYAVAHDSAGKQTRIGRTTIQVDNAHAVAPFGTIDTPGQGGVAAGALFMNYGWALTPWPKEIPRDGSTIRVFVDGVPLGRPLYNYFRRDVFDLFPGYANRDGAVGAFPIDTTKLADGLHTIAWSVQDDAGVTGGIGSRFFTVQNGGAPNGPAVAGLSRDANPALGIEVSCDHEIEMEETGRIAFSFKVPEGMTVIGWGETEERRLPAGSTLDPAAGIFSWIPGPGFLGRYVLHFAAADGRRFGPSLELAVTIIPKDYRDRLESGRASGRERPIKK